MKSFFLAFRFLTIIPLGKASGLNDSSIVASGKYYPLVGLFIGGLLWGFFRGVGLFLPLPVSAGLVLCFWVGLSGALHLDGLADCLDGFYGGTDPEERLRIMKDVHLGTMGVVGIFLALGMKYLLLREILSSPSLWSFLILIPVLSRWAPIFLASLFRYARLEGGLGQALVSGTGKRELFWATLFAWAPVLVLSGFRGLGMILVILIWSLVWGTLSKRKIGGITGDILGAGIETSEIWSLLYVVGLIRYA